MNSRAAIRRRALLTQIQLARKSGISSSRICLWERGEIELRQEQVVRIAAAIYEQLGKSPYFSETVDLARALAPDKFVVLDAKPS
jgi:transcriptional regulator with XRE-family HTH domain